MTLLPRNIFYTYISSNDIGEKEKVRMKTLAQTKLRLKPTRAVTAEATRAETTSSCSIYKKKLGQLTTSG